MTCQPIAPCGYDPCEALEIIGQLLPNGRIWQVGHGRPVYDGFWSAIAAFMSDVSNGLCAEWCEANPCTANRTLERWAAVWNYPTDCTSLDTAKLCQWIKMLTCEARPGSCEFIPQLLVFVGLTGVYVEIDRGCMATSDSRPQIIISAPEWMFFHPGCCDATIGSGWSPTIPANELCDTPFLDCGLIEACGNEETCAGAIPAIECLRHRYFPAGVKVTYQTL
jgi:hypothetical protein